MVRFQGHYQNLNRTRVTRRADEMHDKEAQFTFREQLDQESSIASEATDKLIAAKCGS